MSQNEIVQSQVDSEGRRFKISGLKLSNGCILIVSEGEEAKLGSVAISMKLYERPSTSVITPTVGEDASLSILAEMAANLCGGMAIVSLYAKQALAPSMVKELLSALRNLLKPKS